MYCELKRKSETELLCNLKAIFMAFSSKKAEKKQFNIPGVEIDLTDGLVEVSLGYLYTAKICLEKLTVDQLVKEFSSLQGRQFIPVITRASLYSLSQAKLTL